MRTPRFVISFILSCVFSVAAYEYSGVVVNKTTGNPLEGVLVSVGYSEFYTRTDQDGKFVLENPNTTAAERHNAKPQIVQWYFRGHTLDLRSYQGINSVSIYNIKGKRVFNGLVPPSKVIELSSLPMGVYLLELNGENGQRNIARTVNPARKDLAVSEQLIFRHDDYTPKDIAMTNSNTDMRVELKQDERSFVFDKSKLREYRFTINTDSLKYMNTYGWREQFIPADMEFEGSNIGKIGIRYKGSDYSLPRCFFPNGDTTRGSPNKTCAKISYKLKFTQYDKEKRFYGLKKINLHAFTPDQTKMHEILSYELFRDMGINAPRVSYANVYINNNLIGLFLSVEEIDGRFTKARWPEDGDGNLYKEVWPNSADTKHYLDGLKTNNDPEDNPDVRKMVSYYNAINASNEQNFEQTLSQYMDFDYFLRYLAVDVALKNWDGIRAWYADKTPARNHNYFFYEEENGKIWIIPWDMDQALVQRDSYFESGGFGQALPQWNVPTTNCRSQNANGNPLIPPNCDKLFKLMAAVFWNRYVQLGDIFLNDLFISERLIEKINRHSSLISNAVQQDPNINQSTWTSNVNSLKNYLPNSVSSFKKYIHP